MTEYVCQGISNKRGQLDFWRFFYTAIEKRQQPYEDAMQAASYATLATLNFVRSLAPAY